jgi:hypothetical protein
LQEERPEKRRETAKDLLSDSHPGSQISRKVRDVALIQHCPEGYKLRPLVAQTLFLVVDEYASLQVLRGCQRCSKLVAPRPRVVHREMTCPAERLSDRRRLAIGPR